MADQIIIRGLQLRCQVGVPAEERAEPQNLLAHLTLDVANFPTDDEIGQTVDYKAVSDQVRELVGRGERQLIETLAQEIARYVLAEFPVNAIRVELEKFILPETDWVGVVIERKRGERI